MKRALLVLVVTLAALALPACGKSDPGASLPDRPDAPTGLSASAGSSGSTGTVFGGDNVDEATGPSGGDQAGEDQTQDSSEGDGQGQDGSEVTAADDDLKVFGYATTDETTLAAEMSAIAVTLAELETALLAPDLDAAKAAARTLLDQAETLGADAGAAEKRQQPLEPGDAEMVAARKDAIDAFGLTAEYANSITDIANAALQGQLSEVIALAQDAADLAGTSEELTKAYTDLNTELLAWAEANPADAALALAKYGQDA